MGQLLKLPCWLNGHEEVRPKLSEYDRKILDYFVQIHTQPHRLERTISRLWNQLYARRLFKVVGHPDYPQTISATYEWMCAPTITLTSNLLGTVESLCHSPDTSLFDDLVDDLNLIQTHCWQGANREATKRYLKAKKNIRQAVEQAQSRCDNLVQEMLNGSVQREPRIKAEYEAQPLHTLNLDHPVPEGTIYRPLAGWINSYLYWRIRELYTDSKNQISSTDSSLNVSVSRDSSESDSYLDRIEDGSQPWQDAPTFDQIWSNDNLLAELSQVEESEILEQFLSPDSTAVTGTSSDSDPLEHPLNQPHVSGYTQLTRCTLAQLLFREERPDWLEQIADQYNIPFKEFYQALPATFDAIEQYCQTLGLDPQQPWRTQPELRAALLRGYIMADPDEWLCQSLNREGTYPTGQEVASRLYLKDPADTIQDIAKEFDILTAKGKAPDNFYQAINGNTRSNINKSAWGLVDRLAGHLVEYYPRPARLRSAIKLDQHDLLHTCHVRHHPQCNAQFLAMRRLKILGNVQSFTEIAEELAQQGSQLKLAQIEKHWYERCLPRIGRLIQILDRKDNSETSDKGGQS